ncbi:MAG: hypothetical protein AAGF14_05305 [Pseudomonadota bacterium]
MFLLKNAQFSESYATFSIKPGEILSVGVLGLYTKENTVYKVEVRDFSAQDKAALAKEFPNQFPQAKTRLMNAKLRKPGQS